MKSPFPIKPLGEIIQLEYGKPLPQSDRTSQSAIPAYGANGILCWSKKAYREAPSIIVGRKGSAGEVNLTSGPFWPTDVTYFVEHDQRETDLQYLFYLLKYLELPKLAKGVKPGINRNDVYGLNVPVPELHEQQRIVAILDEAFEGITKATGNAERNLANARELLAAVVDFILDGIDSCGTESTLGEIAEFKNGLNFTRTSKGATIKIVGVKDFKNDYWVPLEGLETVTIDGKLSAAYELREGDILTVRSNGNKQLIGRCLLAGPITEKTSHSGFTIRIRCTDPKVSPTFLTHVLKSRKNRSLLVASGGGTNISSLNQKALSNLPIVFPNLEEQHRLTALIENQTANAKALVFHYEQKLLGISHLKRSLLHKAFSGELTTADEHETNVDLAAVATTASPQYTADILAFAYAKHRSAQRDRTFGRVKGQKVIHLVESVAGVDLGREPIKDAAGPNDSAHMRRAEDWASQQNYFAFEARGTGGYDFKPGQDFEKTLASAYAHLSPHKDAIAKVIDLIVPMDSQEAEVLATVHAAWNNLIIDGIKPTKDAIIAEARENWAESKLAIPVTKFENAIRFIRQNDIIPDGSAKPVRARQESLF